jgi:hypothetical protein
MLVGLGLLACLAAALEVRTDGLADRGVWLDEAFSWRMGLNTDAEIVRLLRRGDNSPPLHFLLLKYWMRAFGDSPAALRSLSAVAGLVSVVGVFLFARALLTGPLADPARVTRREATWVPLLAAAFVALSPLQVRYGWEARMYALGTALATLSAWALARALDPHRARWGWWLLFAGITTLFAYTHTFALLTIAAEAAVVGWWLFERCGSPIRVVREPAFWPAACAFGLVGVGFGFWVPSLLDQIANPSSREWIPALTGYRRLYETAHQLFVTQHWAETPFGAIRTAAVAALLILAAAWRGRWADGVPLTLGLVPIAGAVALCLVGTQVLFTRYLIFAQPFLLVVLATSIARIRTPALFAVVAAAAVAAHGYWYHDMWRRTALDKHPGYRGAAEHIAGHGAEADHVLCGDGRVFLSVRYHLRGRPNVYGVYHPVYGVEGGHAFPDERVDFRPADELVRAARGRVWVVNLEMGGELRNPVPVPKSWREMNRFRFPEALGLETVVVFEYRVSRHGAGQLEEGGP